jgi:predicted transposase/invertase (TIGR01784 family)
MEGSALKKVGTDSFSAGEAKGKAEGLVKGEEKAMFNAARTMLTKGFSKSDISSITGLSISEIDKIEMTV